jgi:thioredoxin-dependent peroxiredoxin
MSTAQETKLENFSLEATNSSITQMQDFAGSWLVIYFYPKDSTSGCTQQAKDFSEYYGKMQRRKVNLIGVSKDSLSSHYKFSEKFAISYPLIADVEQKLCKYFDVIKEKSMYGRKYMGIERSTFIINPDQEIVAEYRRVKVPGHAKDVWDACQEFIDD